MFDAAFPSNLTEELCAVRKVMPERTFSDCPITISKDTISYALDNRIMEFPDRMYLMDIADTTYDILNQTQKQILCCIYTRSCDGYVREIYLRRLLDMPFDQWAIPFIVKLCDEYVLEIIEVIYNQLKDRDNTDIQSFCANNKTAMGKSYARMTSYWNEYYRKREWDFGKYVGRRLFRECLGYNRTFEK